MIGAQGPSNYPAIIPDFINQTGQKLFRGEVVQLDWLQVAAASTPTAAQTAAGLDAVTLGTDNLIIPSTAGVLKNSPIGVIVDDVVAIGARCKVCLQGIVPVAITGGAVAIGDHLIAANATVLAATNAGTGPALSFAWALDPSTLFVNNANGEPTIRCWVDGMPRRQNQGTT